MEAGGQIPAAPGGPRGAPGPPRAPPRPPPAPPPQPRPGGGGPSSPPRGAAGVTPGAAPATTCSTVVPSGISHTGASPNRSARAAVSATSAAGSLTTNLNAARPDLTSATSASGTTRRSVATPEVASFGLTTHRSTLSTRAAAGMRVPFVSTWTRNSTGRARSSRSSAGCCSSGSPPVTTSRSTPVSTTHSATSDTDLRDAVSAGAKRVQSQVSGVSHQEQSRLQRESLRNAQRCPLSGPSPWTLTNVSVTIIPSSFTAPPRVPTALPSPQSRRRAPTPAAR